MRTKKAQTSKASSSSQNSKTRKAPLGKLLASSGKFDSADSKLPRLTNCPALQTDVETREDAVEHLLVYLSGRGDLDEEDKQDLDKNVEGEVMEAEGATATWNDVKLPKAFQEEQLNVLWQGCFYCEFT